MNLNHDCKQESRTNADLKKKTNQSLMKGINSLQIIPIRKIKESFELTYIIVY